MMPKPTRLTKTVRKMTISGRDTSADYVTSDLRATLVGPGAPHGLRAIPVLANDGPESLIDMLSTLQE